MLQQLGLGELHSSIGITENEADPLFQDELDPQLNGVCGKRSFLTSSVSGNLLQRAPASPTTPDTFPPELVLHNGQNKKFHYDPEVKDPVDFLNILPSSVESLDEDGEDSEENLQLPVLGSFPELTENIDPSVRYKIVQDVLAGHEMFSNAILQPVPGVTMEGKELPTIVTQEMAADVQVPFPQLKLRIQNLTTNLIRAIKAIHGFKKLSKPTQLTILKYAQTPFYIIEMSKHYDARTNSFKYFYGFLNIRSSVFIECFWNEVICIGERLLGHDMDDFERAILTAMWLTSEEFYHDPPADLVEWRLAHQVLYEALKAHIEGRDNNLNRMQSLEAYFPVLKQLTKLFIQFCGKLLMELPDIGMPAILQEITDVDKA